MIELYGSGYVEKGEVGLLAITLAREAIFGNEIMAECTPTGTKNKKALPQKELFQIKLAIFQLYPNFWLEPERFEDVWRVCHTAIQQACGRQARDAKKRSQK